MKKSLIFSLTCITVFIMFSACGSKQQKANTSLLSEEVIPVKIMPVQQSVQSTSINTTGLLTTENEAVYSFKISGVIGHINIDEGQYFKKGQLLASLKTTEIDAQLAQAKLGYEKAQRDYSRASNLYNDSVYTLEQLENTKTGLDIAQQNIDAICFNKKYAYIYANADGFVTKKIANEGEVINGSAPAFAINETSGTNDWVLKCGVTDKEWAIISVGDNSSVMLDAFPGKAFAAKVFRKSQAADQASGSFQIEIKLNVANSKPAIGMFGKAFININNKNSLTAIPYNALMEADGNSAYVFVPSTNHTVKKVPVVIESFNNNSVQIKSGLENVADIIISNSAFLNENSTINIIK